MAPGPGAFEPDPDSEPPPPPPPATSTSSVYSYIAGIPVLTATLARLNQRLVEVLISDGSGALPIRELLLLVSQYAVPFAGMGYG